MGEEVEEEEEIEQSLCTCYNPNNFTRLSNPSWVSEDRPTGFQIQQLWIPVVLFVAIVLGRLLYVKHRVTQYESNLAKIIPKPYFPTTGSVWSLKRHQYDYPQGIEILSKGN